MQTDRVEKYKISSYFYNVTKRSMSYNDLKKKRLMRSYKSKTKLVHDCSERLIVRTEKKKLSYPIGVKISTDSKTPFDLKFIERSVNYLKDVFDEIKYRSKTKKYSISKPSFTDRNPDSKKLSIIDKSLNKQYKVNALYESIDLAGDEKDLIKRIIQKKKSQRRLLKFEEIRAYVKRSKSKSKSRLHEEYTATNSNNVNSLSHEKYERSKSKKNLRVNKFETVKEKPVTIPVTYRPSNTQNEIVQKYPTVSLINKESLAIKGLYRSRRKLKIEDFKTERRYVDKIYNGDSPSKIKFQRKLKKTNSYIILKTKYLMYDKSKYMNKMEHKTIIIKSPKKQYQNYVYKYKIYKIKNVPKYDNSKVYVKYIKLTSLKTIESPKNEIYEEIHNEGPVKSYMKEFELSTINISEIYFKKYHSVADIYNYLYILQAIYAQELYLEMKRGKHHELYPEISKYKKALYTSKYLIKKNGKKSCQTENAENIYNLSNILDFMAFPAKDLRSKINKCSTKIVKKKNELYKFKKIFPINFFNN